MFPLERMGIRKARKKIIHLALGNVLEIGAGSGVNLKYYDYTKIEKMTFIDSSFFEVIHKKIKKAQCTIPCETIEMDIEDLKFPDKSFDTVVFSLVFCSVTDVSKGLSEVKRVLKDDGQVLFIEHVLPHKKGFRKLVSKVAPLWFKMSKSCHLDRDFETSILNAGFQVGEFYRYGNTIFTSGIAKKPF